MIDADRVLELANDLKVAGKPFALVTVVRCVSPTSAKPGFKAVVEPDGSIRGWIGGGCAQPAVVKMAKKAIADRQPRLIRISPGQAEVEEGIVDFGMACHSGGTLDIFVDPIVKKPVLLVLGMSPMAQALTGLAGRVGFHVIAGFPGADDKMFPDADDVFDGMTWAVSSGEPPGYVVVATQGKRDESGLEAALASGAPYIAFVASQRKWQKLSQYLSERGHHEERVNSIVAPAGVEIGAATPEEIALSVLAGIVKARREETKIVPEGSISEAAEVSLPKDPVCGMSVDPAMAEHASDYRGKTYYFCCAGCKHKFEKDPESCLSGGR
jgi:xanthine dehydrogenase accessory factor